MWQQPKANFRVRIAYLSIFAAMQKLRYAFVLLVSFAAIEGFAQYRWDFGVNLGAANYLGEIGGLEETRRDFVFDMKLNRTQYVFGGFARYKLTPTIAANFGINYGRIRGNDFNSENPARVARNLSFRNNILEFSLRAEVTLFYDNDAGGRGFYNPDFRVYGFMGLALFHHNPRAKYYGPLEEFDGELVDLIDLETEGVQYENWQLGVPAGLGLFFTFNKVHRVGWEIGYRFTFTDYLDDVSTQYANIDVNANPLAHAMANRTTPEARFRAQELAIGQGVEVPNAGSFAPGEKRGDPTNNDGFLFTQVSYSYVLQGKSNFARRKYSYLKGKKRVRRKTRAKF
jgi:hypothetical protein